MTKIVKVTNNGIRKTAAPSHQVQILSSFSARYMFFRILESYIASVWDGLILP